MTTVVAAYLCSKIESYVERLQEKLKDSRLRIVHSAGGLLTSSEAKQNPHRLSLSGPAAGLRGALAVGKACGETNLVTLDMGGTSTDVALLADGELPYTWQTKISDYPLRAPTLEIHTIGAGGGSLAQLDATGLLRVGPESAGAAPGPACYARGGTLATVTDALCWNGFLPATLGDEKLPINKELSQQALDALGGHASLDCNQMADGILAIAANHLASAVRKVSTGQGRDPAQFSLFCFGGAGPLMACQVAELLEIPKILIPNCAGVLSAWGALCAPWEREWSAPLPPGDWFNDESWADTLSRLRKQAEGEFAGQQDLTWLPLLSRRYKGQGETLVSAPDVDFHDLHQQRFGFSRPSMDVQTIEVRLRASAKPIDLSSSVSQVQNATITGTRRIRWYGETLDVTLYEGGNTFPQATPGPFLLFQEGATVFVAPGWEAESLAGGHLGVSRD